MASFDITLPIILGFENGYVFDPTDPGGETNKGITMETFQQSSHALLGIDPTSDNLKALSDAQAGILYRTLYWDKVHGDGIACQDLANLVCDFYVNAGTHASSLLQTVLNQTGANVIVDGVIGAASLQALAVAPQNAVYDLYRQGRVNYYKQLGVRFPQFLKGWLARATWFPQVSSC